MSRLVLIRHAQATFSQDPLEAFEDYDQLSPLGLQQAEALGAELVASGTVFDKVFVGPAVRHRQTMDAVASSYMRSEVPWPAPVLSEELAEHQGARVVERAIAAPDYGEDLIQLAKSKVEQSNGEIDQTRMYFEVYRRVTRQWARCELPASIEVEETWQAFRCRVESALHGILEETGKGEAVGIVTSGGPVGCTVAWILGLDDQKALELAWVVQNATLTEVLFSGGRMSLKSFNVQPRMRVPEFATYV